MDKNEKNEKSEKRRFSIKPKIETKDKGKRRMSVKPVVELNEKENNKNNNNNINKRRQSKMIKPQTQENDNFQQNVMIQGTPGIQLMQGAAPSAQLQYYQLSPQMYQNGVPIMVGAMPGQGLPPNAYITNQIGPVMPYPSLNYGLDPNVTINKFCPYCGQKYEPRVEESFNCCTCFAYIFLILLIPILLVLAAYSGCQNVNCNNGCDCNCCYCGTCQCNCCMDKNFYCSKCGKKMHRKSSCIELCPCFSCFEC